MIKYSNIVLQLIINNLNYLIINILDHNILILIFIVVMFNNVIIL